MTKVTEDNVYQRPKKHRHFYLILAIGLVAAAGVWFTTFFTNPNRAFETSNQTAEGPTIIESLRLGTLADPEQAAQENPRLLQTSKLQSGQPIALEVATASRVVESIEINVRLLTPEGEPLALDPSSVELQAGQSTYCCWVAPDAGQYLFQIFRPEGNVTSIPLTITPAFQQQQFSL